MNSTAWKKARLESGLSVSAAARKHGISCSTVRRMDAGHTPNSKTLRKIISSWPARDQFAFYSHLFSGPWKETAESPEGAPMCKRILEMLKNKMDREENDLKQAA